MFCSRHTLRARVVATAALPSRAHSPSRLQRERLPEYGLSAAQWDKVRGGKQLCGQFHLGKCMWGAKCKYLHEYAIPHCKSTEHGAKACKTPIKQE